MKHDVVIVGGGIVGLATAIRLLEARPFTRLLLIEKESALGQHQTGKNSGVIHSGLYYKPGSLKARLCREGYQNMVAFCRSEGITHEICGKIVVATREDELQPLEELYARGVANGLNGMRWLVGEQIRELEPHCAGIKALHVPQTGIVDFAAVAARFGEKIIAAGGEIELGEAVRFIRRDNSHVEIETSKTTRRCTVLVACAGLHSDRLARQTDPDLPLRIVPFRGDYYFIRPEKRYLVRNLIYPVPDPDFPFLGVHLTRTVHGEVECGPNAVLSFAREGYRRSSFNLRDAFDTFAWPGFRLVARQYWRRGFDEFYRSYSKVAFLKTLQRLVPDLREEDLLPGGSGVRAQACAVDGKLLDDFEILDRGNVLHVCNAPSPAATASLAIGATISRLVATKLAEERAFVRPVIRRAPPDATLDLP